LRASSRTGYLRDLAPFRLKEKPELLKEFNTTLSRLEKCKNRREWFAHGNFSVVDNQNPEKVGLDYKGHKIKFATQKIEMLAEEISLLTGWFHNFEWRIDEDAHRALHEKLALQAHQSNSPDSHAKGNKP